MRTIHKIKMLNKTDIKEKQEIDRENRLQVKLAILMELDHRRVSEVLDILEARKSIRIVYYKMSTSPLKIVKIRDDEVDDRPERGYKGKHPHNQRGVKE